MCWFRRKQDHLHQRVQEESLHPPQSHLFRYLVNNLGGNMISECPWLSEMPYKLGERLYFHQKLSITNDNIKVVFKMETQKLWSSGDDLVIQIYLGGECNKKGRRKWWSENILEWASAYGHDDPLSEFVYYWLCWEKFSCKTSCVMRSHFVWRLSSSGIS